MSEEKKNDKVKLPSSKKDSGNAPEKKESVQPDPKILAMTKEEAMAYFELPEWAKREDLDNQFWKLGKIYKAQKDEQKLADLAAAYNIANGTRDRKAAEKKEEESAKHYFGKTKKQWKEFWHYEWWKFAIAAAAVIFIIAIIQVYLLPPKIDFRVASVGHFTQDAEILLDYLENNKLAKAPDVDMANVISENDEGEEVDPYATQRAVALIAVRPDIIAFDAMNAPVYVNSENLSDLDAMWAKMQETWTEEQLSHIEPYIYSKARFYEEYAASLPEIYQEDLEELQPEDYIDHVYGFIIKDKIDQQSLGYTVMWKESDSSLIIGVNLASGQIERAQEVLLKILSDIPTLRSQYLELHPYAESTD